MTAYNNIDSAIAGLKSGLGDSKVSSCVAGEAIAFGRPVFAYDNDVEKVYNFKLDVSTNLYSADFSSSNVIALSVNGVAITPITYATDHATTLAALVAAVDALAGVECISSAEKTLLIRTKGADCVVVTSVSGGSAVTVTTTTGSGSVFVGVSLFTQKVGGTYAIYDSVNVLREGNIWVTCNTAAEGNMIAYLDIAGADKGAFTNAAGTDIGCKFQSNLAATGLALIEVNGQVALASAASF